MNDQQAAVLIEAMKELLSEVRSLVDAIEDIATTYVRSQGR